MSTLYSIGAMNQLGDALETAGFTPKEVTKLKQYKDLGKIRDVLSGKALISYPEYLIDCDADPFILSGLTVVEHKKGGLWKWNPLLTLHLVEKQEKGTISGDDLRKELSDLPVLNANVLDYLWEHPDLIPENWKGKVVFFWGTIYGGSDGKLYVRYLFWDGSRWFRYYFWLGGDFHSGCPAALASDLKA